MNSETYNYLEKLLPASYVQQAGDAYRTREKLIQQLIYHRKIPIDGWDEQTIEIFLARLSAMDSNNFPFNCGLGEREARFASGIVARRHFRFGHGIGRSGDLTEVQPKAAGSSLISKLTNCLLKDLIKFMGIEDDVTCVLAPVATGMSIVLSLLTIRHIRPNSKYVLWTRVDQKSCFKSIVTAGFEPIIIEPLIFGDQLITNVVTLEAKVKEIGADNISCIITTSSCFAPRSCDSIEEVAKLCKQYLIPHLINNAYGLQSHVLMKRIQRAKRNGRVDIFIQSTDKNLMVPIGGTIIAGFNKELIEQISQTYPGRANFSPTLDVFITLLNIGKEGYNRLITESAEMYTYLQEKLHEVANIFNERVLFTPENPICLAISLNTFKTDQLTKIGSMLFMKCVSGTRVITTTNSSYVSDYNFIGWGAHCQNYITPYLTCAAAIGLKKTEIDVFIKRLKEVLTKMKREITKD